MRKKIKGIRQTRWQKGKKYIVEGSGGKQRMMAYVNKFDIDNETYHIFKQVLTKKERAIQNMLNSEEKKELGKI